MMEQLDPTGFQVAVARTFFELKASQGYVVAGGAGLLASALGLAATRQRLDDDDHQLLSLMAAGLQDAQIARQLGVRTRTVSRRVARLLRILDADTRFQAGLQASRRGVL